MREGGGVDDYACGTVVTCGVQAVDDVAFVVGLEVREGDVEVGGAGGEGGDEWRGGWSCRIWWVRACRGG